MELMYVAYQDAEENFVFYCTGSITNGEITTLVSIYWSPFVTTGRMF